MRWLCRIRDRAARRGRCQAVSAGSYGANSAGLSRASFDPRTWYQLFVSPSLTSLSVHCAAGAVLLLIYGCWPNHRRARPYLLAVAVSTIAYLVPQLVLYRQGMSAHYLFPAIVAPAAVAGLALGVHWRRPHWITRAALVGAVVSLFVLFSRGIAVATKRVRSVYRRRAGGGDVPVPVEFEN